MLKSLQHKKPAHTSNTGVAKIVSINGLQLVNLLKNASKKKTVAKIERRISTNNGRTSRREQKKSTLMNYFDVV